MKATRRGRRVRRGFARTLAAGGTCLALAVGTSVYGAVGAHADETAFRNGKANAVAQIERVAPGVGSLQLGMTTGRSIADMTNNLAQAQAQTLDLGLIGTSLTGEQCDGSPGPVSQKQLPAPITVDNREGDASKTFDSYPIAGAPLGGGREAVAATTAPSAHAEVSAVASSLGGVAELSNGHSETSAQVVDGAAREAEGFVSADLDIAGVVQLHNLQWHAVHRTGEAAEAGGSFSMDSATVGSVPVPVDQMGPLQDAINTALAASGITVVLPHVEHITAPNDVITVTPLTITLKDSPAGKATLGPGLNLTREQREQLFDTIVGFYCKAASTLLVGDITLDVLSGTGFMIVEIGGVQVTSGDFIQGNPFGDFAPIQQAGASLPDNLTFANGAPVSGPAGATVAAEPAAAELGPLKAVCESIHPTREPLCSHGLGVPVGIAGVLVTGGIAALDWRRQKRLLPSPAGSEPA